MQSGTPISSNVFFYNGKSVLMIGLMWEYEAPSYLRLPYHLRHVISLLRTANGTWNFICDRGSNSSKKNATSLKPSLIKNIFLALSSNTTTK